MITLQSIFSLVQRELLIAFRNRHQALNPLFFFGLVCLLFPLGMNPSSTIMVEIAPSIIWTALLLATLMTLSHLFRTEYEDGTLELMVLAKQPLALLVIVKLFSHWLITVLPLIVLTPLIATALGMEAQVQMTLLLTFLLGTPVLLLVGATVSTLTLVTPQNGMLLALLVLPLYVPVLIFGSSAVNAVADGFSPAGPLYVLAAMCLVSFSLAPFAIAAAIKIGVSQ